VFDLTDERADCPRRGRINSGRMDRPAACVLPGAWTMA
jgi:hypothetical protein